MKTALFAVAALASATSALAATGEVRAVQADDRVIHYTVEPQQDGSYILASTPREPEFRLRVKDGRVSGQVQGQSVYFNAPRAKPVKVLAD